MAGFRGMTLFALSFPPDHQVKMLVSSEGVRVLLGNGRGEENLRAFLMDPPQGFFATVGELLGALVKNKGQETGEVGEEEWPSLGDEKDRSLTGDGWWGEVKVVAPFSFRQLLQEIQTLVSRPRGKGGGPLSFSLAVERAERELVRTTLSLFRGGDITTVVDARATVGDLGLHSALLGCFFLFWRRMGERVVAFLKLLERLGLIIFF